MVRLSVYFVRNTFFMHWQKSSLSRKIFLWSVHIDIDCNIKTDVETESYTETIPVHSYWADLSQYFSQ